MKGKAKGKKIINPQNGDEFRLYVEDKYKGRTVVSDIDQVEITVDDISDLTFEDLDLEDQKLAVHPQIMWAFGAINSPNLREATKIKGFLFRPKQRTVWVSGRRYIFYEGAAGSGKSLLLCLRAVALSMMYPGTRGVFVRDTFPNLQRTILQTLEKKVFAHFGWMEDVNYKHHSGKHEYYINTGNTYSTILYMPAKNEGVTIEQMVKDFGSLEVDWIVGDEFRDIDEPIFLALAQRLGRWGKIRRKEHRQMMIASNPADPEHYLALRFEHGLNSKKEPLVNFKDHLWTVSTTYENKRNLEDAYIKDLESRDEYWRDTYLYGKRSFHPPEGEAVYPAFNHDRYVSKKPLIYLKGQPLLRGWDGGPTARWKACVVCQRNPGGQLIILKEFLSDEPGIENFARNVMETCNVMFPLAAGAMDYGDPAMFDDTQTDNRSVADIMMRMGIALMRGEKFEAVRINAVVKCLSKDMYNNISPVLIDPSCIILINGFMGGYHRKRIDINTGRSGGVVKNKFSHICEALQYLLSKMVMVEGSNKNKYLKWVKNHNQGLYQRANRLNRRIIKQKSYYPNRGSNKTP